MGIMRTDSFVGSITRSRFMRPRSSAKTMPNSLNAGLEIEPISFVANVVSLKRKVSLGSDMRELIKMNQPCCYVCVLSIFLSSDRKLHHASSVIKFIAIQEFMLDISKFLML